MAAATNGNPHALLPHAARESSELGPAGPAAFDDRTRGALFSAKLFSWNLLQKPSQIQGFKIALAAETENIWYHGIAPCALQPPHVGIGVTWIRCVVWLGVGLLLYALYGTRRSGLGVTRGR